MPSALIGLLGNQIFEAYPPERFSSDQAFRQFAWHSLQLLGVYNPMETHALLIEPVLERAPPSEAIDRLSPAPLRDLGLDRLGLEWLDGAALQRHLPLSFFGISDLSSAFAGPVLCDPFYGSAIIEHDGAWRTVPFVTDLAHKRAARNPAERTLVDDPSAILSDGVRFSSLFLRHLFDGEEQASLAALEVPEVTISSLAELERWQARIEAALAVIGKRARIWFRGQPGEYMMPDRAAAVAQGFLPHSQIRDASIVPSLYRNTAPVSASREVYWRYLRDVLAWQDAARAVFGEDYQEVPLGAAFIDEVRDGGLEFTSHLVARDSEGNVVGGRTRHYHMEYSFWQRGLLLQHYGCPTPFIDITSSIAVAHWFATRRFAPSGEGRLFAPIEWGEDDEASWPRIYGFILVPGLHPIVDSKQLNRGNVSLRAERQSCGLLGGGGLLARNYAARFLSLKFKLHPALARETNLDEETLFPGVGEDPVYRMLRERPDVQQDNQFPLYGL